MRACQCYPEQQQQPAALVGRHPLVHLQDTEQTRAAVCCCSEHHLPVVTSLRVLVRDPHTQPHPYTQGPAAARTQEQAPPELPQHSKHLVQQVDGAAPSSDDCYPVTHWTMCWLRYWQLLSLTHVHTGHCCHCCSSGDVIASPLLVGEGLVSEKHACYLA
jgi:hypothetical protein